MAKKVNFLHFCVVKFNKFRKWPNFGPYFSLLEQHSASSFEKISASKVAQIDTKHHFESNFPFSSGHFPYLVFLVSEEA